MTFILRFSEHVILSNKSSKSNMNIIKHPALRSKCYIVTFENNIISITLPIRGRNRIKTMSYTCIDMCEDIFYLNVGSSSILLSCGLLSKVGMCLITTCGGIGISCFYSCHFFFSSCIFSSSWSWS